jgi:bifunctional DNA-binding transcriptional regulator/antitoxin component of YhaV-PrlF toxin-antitoxin module
MKQYTVKLEGDILPIPDELMEELGWKIGDEVVVEETEIFEEHGSFRGITIAFAEDYKDGAA